MPINGARSLRLLLHHLDAWKRRLPALLVAAEHLGRRRRDLPSRIASAWVNARKAQRGQEAHGAHGEHARLDVRGRALVAELGPARERVERRATVPTEVALHVRARETLPNSLSPQCCTRSIEARTLVLTVLGVPLTIVISLPGITRFSVPLVRLCQLGAL